MISSTQRRVVITGMGLISPLGNSTDALWEALRAGKSGVGPFASLPTVGLPTTIAAEASDFTGHFSDFGPLPAELKKAVRKGLKVMCRESQMGVASAQLAIAHAGRLEGGNDPQRSGVVFGSDYMLSQPEELSDSVIKCSESGHFEYPRWGTDGLEQMAPLWLLKYLPNMPASHIAIYNDFRGPNNSLTHREAAANLAIGEAYRTILRDSADCIVAGATGTRVHPMKAIHAAQTEQLAAGNGDPAKASRPFDRDRTGMVLGEGAGSLVLEELAIAQARGAKIYAEVIGAASSSVADRNMVAHRDRALANAIRATLRDAGASPEDVGHIHAHGLSTVISDADEATAIREALGSRAEEIPVVAAKSQFGNLGAGSAVVELIASVLAFQHDSLFPVLNYETPDPDCPIAAVTSADVSPGETFLNLSVTPQGQAAVVMLRSFE